MMFSLLFTTFLATSLEGSSLIFANRFNGSQGNYTFYTIDGFSTTPSPDCCSAGILNVYGSSNDPVRGYYATPNKIVAYTGTNPGNQQIVVGTYNANDDSNTWTVVNGDNNKQQPGFYLSLGESASSACTGNYPVSGMMVDPDNSSIIDYVCVNPNTNSYQIINQNVEIYGLFPYGSTVWNLGGSLYDPNVEMYYYFSGNNAPPYPTDVITIKGDGSNYLETLLDRDTSHNGNSCQYSVYLGSNKYPCKTYNSNNTQGYGYWSRQDGIFHQLKENTPWQQVFAPYGTTGYGIGIGATGDVYSFPLDTGEYVKVGKLTGDGLGNFGEGRILSFQAP